MPTQEMIYALPDAQTISWDAIRAASEELDQMASQTVHKACDVGDMLRVVRLTMEPEVFGNAVSKNLSRSDRWARMMIVLSFRRGAVVEALANGTANDSIRSAYEHVKALPAPPDEEAERAQWPRAKRGPNPGEGGRPKAPVIALHPSPQISDVERSAIQDGLREGGQMIADFAERQADREQAKADLAQQPAYQNAAAIYRQVLTHLAAADTALVNAKDLAYFNTDFWDSAMAHATRIVKHLEKML